MTKEQAHKMFAALDAIRKRLATTLPSLTDGQYVRTP